MTLSPFWYPKRHATRRPLLIARGKIQNAIRRFLNDQNFLEADPSALQISPGNEAHLHAFATQIIGNDGQAHPMYLHTSPEFALKKLLAAGESRLYAFAHVWRNRERGPLHSPEFTMLEWYRAGEEYTQGQEDCLSLLRVAAQTLNTPSLRYQDKDCDPFAPPQHLSVAQAFHTYAHIDLLATLAGDGTPQREALAKQLSGCGIKYTENDSWSDMFSYVLSTKIEPHLGLGRPTLLDHYPAPEAALARPNPNDPRLAQRFELYACGVELANGFSELTDPAEQRRRFEADMRLKQRLYKEHYPIDDDFLAALPHIPTPTTGVALGFDRLVMLATGAPQLDDVLWAPVAQP